MPYKHDIAISDTNGNATFGLNTTANKAKTIARTDGGKSSDHTSHAWQSIADLARKFAEKHGGGK